MVTKKGPLRVIDKNLKSVHDNSIKTGHVQREFHGMPAGRHETIAVTSWPSVHRVIETRSCQWFWCLYSN